MSKKGRRTFSRPYGNISYYNIFIIATEGKKTEPQYFQLFNKQSPVLKLLCIKGDHKSSPLQVLQRMKDYLKTHPLKSKDEAWLVVDRDQWTDEQLRELHKWSTTAENYSLALSNPNFEYWLLLHFDDGIGVTNGSKCSQRLRQHLPNYDKGIPSGIISREMVEEAIRRAKRRDTPPCEDWPHDPGCTTVYRLVEKILSA